MIVTVGMMRGHDGIMELLSTTVVTTFLARFGIPKALTSISSMSNSTHSKSYASGTENWESSSPFIFVIHYL